MQGNRTIDRELESCGAGGVHIPSACQTGKAGRGSREWVYLLKRLSVMASLPVTKRAHERKTAFSNEGLQGCLWTAGLMDRNAAKAAFALAYDPVSYRPSLHWITIRDPPLRRGSVPRSAKQCTSLTPNVGASRSAISSFVIRCDADANELSINARAECVVLWTRLRRTGGLSPPAGRWDPRLPPPIADLRRISNSTTFSLSFSATLRVSPPGSAGCLCKRHLYILY